MVRTSPSVTEESGAPPELVCPHCHRHLNEDHEGLRCAACVRTYPVRDGVPCFAHTDEFYESRYDSRPNRFVPDESKPWDLALLYLTTQHYLWYIRRFFARPGKILDLACGGGVRYLARQGTAIGTDISLLAARSVDESYAGRVQADAFHLPYTDGTFDYIAGKCIFEHIPMEHKPALLAELHRVLRPGGRVIMLFDCENTNPLWRWAQRDPHLFQQAFIENDGHYGLMLPSAALRLLQEHGFRVIAYQASNKTALVHLPMLMWLRAYRGRSRLVDRYVRIGDRISRHRSLIFAYTFLVTLWDDVVEPLYDLDRARYLLVACEKAE